MQKNRLGLKTWSALLIFGLFGQLAWTVENMYFNVFVYNTIDSNPSIIANMVAASAVTATVTTLLMGALSDRLGKRKAFIVYGYILWGLSTLSFAFISVDRVAAWFPGLGAVQIAAAFVIIMDCIMTFFGSSANDAAFNAWVTDVTNEKNRGRVESVLAVLPLVAMLIIFGGFDGFTQQGRWDVFFLSIGSIITAGGLLGLFFIKDVPSLTANKKGYFKNIVFGLQPSVVKGNPSLYLSLTALALLGISTQIFMPYLIIYIQKYLGIVNYAILLGIVLIASSIASVAFGRMIDRVGKLKFMFPAVLVSFAGLVWMFFAREMGYVIAAGFVMLGGNMLVTASINGLVRDHTPADKVGHFQGIRMLFAVLLPMVTGPYIGAAVIKNSNQIYTELGVVKHVPTPGIFIAAAATLLLVLVPAFLLNRKKAQPPQNRPLKTKWGENLDPDHVLKEYPRPQMKRDSYLNLNGLWQYAINTSENLPEAFDGEILVPFSPESVLSGVNRQLMPGETLWYCRRFSIPNGFDKGRMLLHFGAVDQQCRVYLNGTYVGEHIGGYLPFYLDVTQAVKKEGENQLVVMARDDSNHSHQAYGKQSLERGGIWYTAQSGIWQTVWIESVPENYIDSITVTPLYDEAAVEIAVNIIGNRKNGRMIIFDDGNEIAQSALNNDGMARIAIANFKSWSPESPFLYTFTVETPEDRIESYFGMRKFSTLKDENGVPRLFLNNKPYFHNGVLDQGYWSDGLYTAPSDEALIYDIQAMKDAGFNMLRKHIKIEPLRWYYHCDRLGMIVWQDMVSGGSKYNPAIIQVLPFLNIMLKDHRYPLFGRRDAAGREQFLSDMQRTVALLYNTVSLGVWVPFNEGWGQFDALSVTEHLRLLDNTRTIDHASGWHDQGGGDLKSVHVYYRKVKVKPDVKQRAVVVSEFGGYSFRVDGHCYSQREFGYRRFASLEEFSNAYRALYEREMIPAIPKGLSACVYTQVSDVEDELNGLLTFDRKHKKLDDELLRSINARVKL